jgi:hypothetical protein
MSVPVIAGVIAVGGAVAVRERSRDPQMPGAEVIVLGGAMTLALVGVLASLLGLTGWFRPSSLTIGLFGLAGAAWPWRQRALSKMSVSLHPKAWVVPLLIVIGGLALRMPPNEYPLAGRDQGTYSLRAHQLARTGRFDAIDPVLAKADDRPSPGSTDLRGLYPVTHEDWREDRYEGAYRPGWYLADRETGRVVPQFLHLHPSLLAVGLIATGSESIVVAMEVALALLALWCVARRLFGPGWALLGAGLFAAHPLAIWVGRTTLSESPTLLLLAAALLAVVRSGPTRPPPQPSAELMRAAVFLGAIAWVRGNGWLWAPVILGLLWFVPSDTPDRRRPPAVYLAVVVAAVFAHAASSFPYLYDELHRMAQWTGPITPTRIVVGVSVAAVAWWSIDELSFSRLPPERTQRLLRVGPPALLGLAALAIAAYLWMRGDAATRPFSRLDPAVALMGVPLIVAAVVGAFDAALRVRLRAAAGVWVLALAALLVLTLGLYSRRNLPQLGLYYYGRYLAVELLPAACLFAVHALRRLYAWMRAGQPLRSRRGVVATSAAVVLAGGLAWSTSGVLVREPSTRLNEFADADQILEGLARRLPPDAIVIAGGEGWHAGHTFNQVGGALQARYGVDLVPYRTREAAYSTLYRLVVEPPATPGEARPVYLLVNEATHHMRRSDDDTLVAAFDDQLWPPLRATEVWPVEMFVDRLSPVNDAVPSRVTRDELRMVLMRVEVDPNLAGHHVFPLDRVHSNLHLSGGGGRVGPIKCLSDETPLRIELDELPDGPGGLVLVATEKTAGRVGKLRVTIDGQRRRLDPPKMPSRERNTIGPLTVARPPKTIEVLGLKRSEAGQCPHGGLLEIRWLEAPRALEDWTEAEAITYGPRHDLGHPVRPTGWVRGRGLGRFRAGVTGVDRLVGMAMRLVPDAPLRFPPEFLPDGPVDVVVTLTGTQLTEGARLLLRADGKEVGQFSPPAQRSGSWQTPPVSWTPPGPVASFELELQGASEGDWVLVRDIGLFSREPPVRGTVAHEGRG